MRTLKSLLFSILAVFILASGASATQVRGHLVDANGQPLNAGRLEFVLGACPTESGPATLVSGGNLTNYGPYVIKAGPGGTIIGQIIGSDQILCGGGLNTYWQVSGFNGNSTTPVWTKAAIITGGLWQADTGPYLNVTPTSLPPNPVLQNPTGDQIVTVPAGKKLQVTGTFIATLTGNATTASALAAAGTDCAAGTFATGVDASGNAVGCAALPTSIAAGTGISVSGATGGVTVTNTGVTSLAGTTNQITASSSTGAVTLSLPSSVTISAITLTGTPGVSATGVNSGTARASHGAFQGDWGNDLFFGHSNTAYLSTIGHDNTAGPPVICFYCYSSLTANGWKYSGAINAPWRVRTTNGTTNGINFDQAAAGTADTDIATWTTIMGVGQTGVSVTGNISASAALIAGTSPATAGTVRLCNACNIAWENAAGTAALIGIAGTAANTLNIGYNQEINTNGGVTFSSASASRFSFMGGGTSIMSARSDGVIGFSATTTPGTNSVGISYGGAANTMACGNGTAGDSTCTLKAGTVNAGTGFQVAGAALNFSNLAGSASIAQGGTAQTTFAAGDLLVGTAGSLSRLALGANGLCLTSNGTTAVWGSCSTGTASLSANNTFTGINAFQNIVNITGNSGLGTGGGAAFNLSGGYASPVSSRMIVSDSSGWHLKISDRNNSTTDDPFTFVVSAGGNGFFGVSPAVALSSLATTSLVAGGTLTSGQAYFYKISAIGPDGAETAYMPEVSATPTGTTLSVSLSWTAVPTAQSYRIYRGTTAGGESAFQTSTTNSFTDTGAAGTAGTPPVLNNSYLTKFKNSTGSYIYPGLSIGQTTAATYMLDVLGNSMVSLSNVGRFKSGASSNSFVTLDTTTTGFQATTLYADVGTTKWQVGKDSSNNYIVFDSAAAVNRLAFTASGSSVYATGSATGIHQFQHSDATLAAVNASQYQVSGSPLAASNLSNGTSGSGAVVLVTSPSLTTPSLSSPTMTGTTTAATLSATSITSPTVTTTGAAITLGNGAGTAYIDGSTGISGQGGYLQFTATADSTTSYGVWISNNALFNGTSWTQPRGTLGSFFFGATNQQSFVWKTAAANGTNGAVITPVNLMQLTANGTSGTLNVAGTAAALQLNGVDYSAVTKTFTNTIIDAEGTGNSFTEPVKVWFPAAGCTNSAATPYWDMGTTSIPTAVCVTGTNVVKGLLRYTGSTLAAQFHYKLPDDLKASTTWDVRTLWTTGTASGTATLTIDYACTSSGATDDPAWTTAWVNQALTASATVNAINANTVSAITSTCTAGQIMHFRVRRTDTAGTATNMDVYGIELTYRRTE